MAKTLEELRAALRKGINIQEPAADKTKESVVDLLDDMIVEESDDAPPKTAVDLSKMRHSDFTASSGPGRGGGKHRISADGFDAVLLFGKHNGKDVSAIAREDPGYLRWMLGQDFPKPLLDVIAHTLGISRGEVTPAVDEVMRRSRRPKR